MSEKHRKDKSDRHSGQQIVVRLSDEMMDRLRAEAEQRDLSVAFLVRRAIAEFLPRLVPVDEWKLTRD